MMQMDFAEWLLFVLAMYPIAGMSLYAISLIAMSSEHIRRIAERNNHPPILVVLMTAAFLWPFAIAKVVRRSQAR